MPRQIALWVSIFRQRPRSSVSANRNSILTIPGNVSRDMILE
jgi:hypothetical protein